MDGVMENYHPLDPPTAYFLVGALILLISFLRIPLLVD